LRHQTNTAGDLAGQRSAWFRLDPHILPVRYSARLAGRHSAGVAVIALDRGMAIIRHPMPSGDMLTVEVPIPEYDGVAVRMATVDGAALRVVVELRHRDPELTLPLVVADDPADIVADWQGWARALNLPLLVVEQNGAVTRPVDRIGGLNVARPRPRRRHSFFAGRRPRFLTRRKVGRLGGAAEVISGREIIARD
jgi:hypothetical protein